MVEEICEDCGAGRKKGDPPLEWEDGHGNVVAVICETCLLSRIEGAPKLRDRITELEHVEHELTRVLNTYKRERDEARAQVENLQKQLREASSVVVAAKEVIDLGAEHRAFRAGRQCGRTNLNVVMVEDANSTGLMKHALGWPDCYRNHYCASPGGRDDERWKRLVEEGLAELYRGPDETYPYNTYRVTQAGIDLLKRREDGNID